MLRAIWCRWWASTCLVGRWPAAFNYWFDGLAALAAILAAADAARHARDAAGGKGFAGRLRLFGTGMFTWAFLVGIVGLPYWIVLIPLHELLLGAELRAPSSHSPARGRPWRAGGQPVLEGLQVGYDTCPNRAQARALGPVPADPARHRHVHDAGHGLGLSWCR